MSGLEVFFSDTTGVSFDLFSPLYFVLLFGVAGLAAAMMKFRHTLRRLSDKTQKWLRYSFAGILFLNMTTYYVSLMLTGQYSIKKHLPLEFCFITGYILMYILITNNKNGFYSTIFYCTIIGPLPAMLFPNLSGSYDRFIFYQFVISHHVMMIISFYSIIVLRFRVDNKSAFKAFFYGNIVFVAVSTLNTVWGSNYIMQGALPKHIIKLFPFIKYFNVPFFWLEVCGLLMIPVGIKLQKFFQKDRLAAQRDSLATQVIEQHSLTG